MLPDRIKIESFTWKNKSKLLTVLRENEVTNYVLGSGDIHMAQSMKDECSSLSGLNNLWEFTSSGLTHTQATLIPGATGNMLFFTPLYTQSEALFDKNYGIFDVFDPKSEENLLVKALVKNEQGQEIIAEHLT
jgi:phosphodiesterase/alkaline phosphatase D-like protein